MLREKRVICKNAFDRLKKQLDFFNAAGESEAIIKFKLFAVVVSLSYGADALEPP